MDSAIKKLLSMLKPEKKSTGSDYTATVTRVEGNTAYVQMTGADINDTPVALTINASVGDKVRVRVNNGKAWIMGNDDAPPTDNTYARNVNTYLSQQIGYTNGNLSALGKIVQTVQKIAGNTNQYFWHTETGTDTGAHITEIPQEDFVADPANGGGNLLARSNGIAVRQGLIELATFSQSGMDINTYDSNGNLIPIAHIGYGQAYDAQGSLINAPFHSFGRNPSSAVGVNSFAAGDNTTASAYASFAEGYGSQASGVQSHAEGTLTEATSTACHAEGFGSVASGFASHAQNRSTIARGDNQTVIGKYNIESVYYAFLLGNGSGEAAANRSNAVMIDWNGNTTIAGTLTQSSDKRLKEHKSYLDDDAVEFIRKLKPAHYTKDGEEHVGFYAQDVQETDPWNCMTGEMNGYMTLGYTEIIAPLVRYCQSLEERIKQLENK